MEKRKTQIVELFQGTPGTLPVLCVVNIVQKTLLTLCSALGSGLKALFAVLHEFAKPSQALLLKEAVIALQTMSEPVSLIKPGVGLYAFSQEHFCLCYSHSLYQAVQNKTEMVLKVFSDFKTFPKTLSSVFLPVRDAHSKELCKQDTADMGHLPFQCLISNQSHRRLVFGSVIFPFTANYANTTFSQARCLSICF